MRTITEPVGPGLHRRWDITEVLFEQRTDFQHVLIGRTAQGVTLFCDEERQSSEQSQLVYHEALMLPPLLLAERTGRVLIIGSSEGVASRLAVQWGAHTVDHVDIDRAAVRACAEHLPYGYTPDELAAAERGDGPIRVHYRDGWAFLADAEARGEGYDVVVIDLPDENTDSGAQHNRLYQKDFLLRCAAVLADGGALSTQAGCPTLWRNETLRAAWHRFTALFGRESTVYFGSDEHEWAFLSARTDPGTDPIARMVGRLTAVKPAPASIDADTLRGATVPPFALRNG